MLRQETDNQDLLNEMADCINLLENVQQQQRQAHWDNSISKATEDDSVIFFDGIVYIGLYLDALELWRCLHTGKSVQGFMTPWSLALKVYSYTHDYLTTPVNNNLACALTDYMAPPDIEKIYTVLKTLNINNQLSIPEIKKILLERLDTEHKEYDSKPLDEQYNYHETKAFLFFTDLKTTRKVRRHAVDENEKSNETKWQRTSQ